MSNPPSSSSLKSFKDMSSQEIAAVIDALRAEQKLQRSFMTTTPRPQKPILGVKTWKLA